jgi:hypothetical protein
MLYREKDEWFGPREQEGAYLAVYIDTWQGRDYYTIAETGDDLEWIKDRYTDGRYRFLTREEYMRLPQL